MKPIKYFLSTSLIATSLLSCNFVDDFNGEQPLPNDHTPIIIAHRGAQSIFPEHTIEAYEKAIEQGADYIEPDLVLTKDGHLIVRHEPMLSGTTNVADIPEFAALKTTRELDGKEVTDWFALDFTLAQIKQLKAKQAYSGRSTEYDGLFEIPTFQQVIDLRFAHVHHVHRQDRHHDDDRPHQFRQ